jgi:ribosomal protein RSM22 (predicted rRNA methylase)
MPPISLAPLECALLAVLPGDPGRIAQAAKRLSLMFTSGHAPLPAHYLADADALAAYRAAFLLPNAKKVLHCLAQMERLSLLPHEGPLDILDLGAGPGTASLAASLFFAQRRPAQPIRCWAIDQEAAALQEAQRLFAAIRSPSHDFEAHIARISPEAISKLLGARRFHLIIAANVFNELDAPDAAHRLCQTLLADQLRPHGAFLIIDPALRETARPLMQLRDALLLDGTAHVLAPCLCQSGCPMLRANDRDWCHFYIDWECPALVARIDALSGMRHRHLKMAYLLLRAKGEGCENSSDKDLARVVSSPLDSKGKRELVLCAMSGELRRVRRMHRDASEANRDFDAVVRGDTIRSASPARMGKGDRFAIIDRWAFADEA